MKPTIYVLGGGNSLEREVSLRSSAAVADALETAGYTVERIDPQNGLEFLTTVPKDAIVFPILHGAEGEDGIIQAAMEAQGLAYLGTTSKAAQKCMNKDIARSMFADAGLIVAEGGRVDKHTYHLHPLYSRPHVLKTQSGGSSIGTYLVPDSSTIDQQRVDEIFTLDDEAIIEELIEGIEITVPVLDSTALPVIEIWPPTGKSFDYENKYNGESREICPAESVSDEIQTRAREVAEKAHAIMNCRHLSRTDLFVRPNGELVVLEINTMPGMTSQSLYPKSASVAGIPMPQLVQKFVELVERDYKI